VYLLSTTTTLPMQTADECGGGRGFQTETPHDADFDMDVEALVTGGITPPICSCWWFCYLISGYSITLSVSTGALFLSISYQPMPAAVGAEKAPNPSSVRFVDLMHALGAKKSARSFFCCSSWWKSFSASCNTSLSWCRYDSVITKKNVRTAPIVGGIYRLHRLQTSPDVSNSKPQQNPAESNVLALPLIPNF